MKIIIVPTNATTFPHFSNIYIHIPSDEEVAKNGAKPKVEIKSVVVTKEEVDSNKHGKILNDYMISIIKNFQERKCAEIKSEKGYYYIFTFSGFCYARAILKHLVTMKEYAHLKDKLFKYLPSLKHEVAKVSVLEEQLVYQKGSSIKPNYKYFKVSSNHKSYQFVKSFSLRKVSEYRALLTELGWYMLGDDQAPRALPVINKEKERVGVVSTYFDKLITFFDLLRCAKNLTQDKLIKMGYIEMRVMQYLLRDNDAHSDNFSYSNESYKLCVYDFDRAAWGVKGIENNKHFGFPNRKKTIYPARYIKANTQPEHAFKITAQELEVFPNTCSSFIVNWHDSEGILINPSLFYEDIDNRLDSISQKFKDITYNLEQSPIAIKRKYIAFVTQMLLVKHAVVRIADDYIPKQKSRDAFVQWLSVDTYNLLLSELRKTKNFSIIFSDNITEIESQLKLAVEDRNSKISITKHKLSWDSIRLDLCNIVDVTVSNLIEKINGQQDVDIFQQINMLYTCNLVASNSGLKKAILTKIKNRVYNSTGYLLEGEKMILAYIQGRGLFGGSILTQQLLNYNRQSYRITPGFFPLYGTSMSDGSDGDDTSNSIPYQPR